MSADALARYRYVRWTLPTGLNEIVGGAGARRQNSSKKTDEILLSCEQACSESAECGEVHPDFSLFHDACQRGRYFWHVPVLVDVGKNRTNLNFATFFSDTLYIITCSKQGKVERPQHVATSITDVLWSYHNTVDQGPHLLKMVSDRGKSLGGLSGCLIGTDDHAVFHCFRHIEEVRPVLSLSRLRKHFGVRYTVAGSPKTDAQVFDTSAIARGT